MTVRPAKTRISLGIRPLVWSESSLSAWRTLGPKLPNERRAKTDQTGRMPMLTRVFAGRTLILLVLSCRDSYYIFIEHFKFISICFDVLKRSCVEASIQLRERTHENWFIWLPFCFEKERLPLTDPWIGSEKGILHFTFAVIVCPATVPSDLKFIRDNLSLFGL